MRSILRKIKHFTWGTLAVVGVLFLAVAWVVSGLIQTLAGWLLHMEEQARHDRDDIE